MFKFGVPFNGFTVRRLYMNVLLNESQGRLVSVNGIPGSFFLVYNVGHSESFH